MSRELTAAELKQRRDAARARWAKRMGVPASDLSAASPKLRFVESKIPYFYLDAVDDPDPTLRLGGRFNSRKTIRPDGSVDPYSTAKDRFSERSFRAGVKDSPTIQAQGPSKLAREQIMAHELGHAIDAGRRGRRLTDDRTFLDAFYRDQKRAQSGLPKGEWGPRWSHDPDEAFAEGYRASRRVGSPLHGSPQDIKNQMPNTIRQVRRLLRTRGIFIRKGDALSDLAKRALSEAEINQRREAARARWAKARGAAAEPNKRGALVGWALDRPDRDRLRAAIPPQYGRFVGHHVSEIYDAPDGSVRPGRGNVKVIGVADDGKGLQALVVEVNGKRTRPDGGPYHVTWSLGGNRGGRDADRVVREGWAPVEPIQARARGFLAPGLDRPKAAPATTKPRVTMLVGEPGSGKTTWRKANRPDAVVISTDDIIRAEGGSFTPDNIDAAERRARAMFRDALASGKDVVIDRTNPTAKSRSRWLERVPEGYEREAVVFQTHGLERAFQLSRRGEALDPRLRRRVPVEMPGEGEFARVEVIRRGPSREAIAWIRERKREGLSKRDLSPAEIEQRREAARARWRKAGIAAAGTIAVGAAAAGGLAFRRGRIRAARRIYRQQASETYKAIHRLMEGRARTAEVNHPIHGKVSFSRGRDDPKSRHSLGHAIGRRRQDGTPDAQIGRMIRQIPRVMTRGDAKQRGNSPLEINYRGQRVIFKPKGDGERRRFVFTTTYGLGKGESMSFGGRFLRKFQESQVQRDERGRFKDIPGRGDDARGGGAPSFRQASWVEEPRRTPRGATQNIWNKKHSPETRSRLLAAAEEMERAADRRVAGVDDFVSQMTAQKLRERAASLRYAAETVPDADDGKTYRTFKPQVPKGIPKERHEQNLARLQRQSMDMRAAVIERATTPDRRGKTIVPEGTPISDVKRAYRHATALALHDAGLIDYDFRLSEEEKEIYRPLVPFMRYTRRRMKSEFTSGENKGMSRPYREEFGKPFMDSKTGEQKRNKVTGELRFRFRPNQEFIKADIPRVTDARQLDLIEDAIEIAKADALADEVLSSAPRPRLARVPTPSLAKSEPTHIRDLLT